MWKVSSIWWAKNFMPVTNVLPLSPNLPIFAQLCDTGAGPYKYFSFVSRWKLSHISRWCWRNNAKGDACISGSGAFSSYSCATGYFLVSLISTPAPGFPERLTGILEGRSPENFTGTLADGFLHSSCRLWHPRELSYHPMATNTPAPMGSESQPSLEKEFRTIGEIFKVFPCLDTPPVTYSLVVTLYICYSCILQSTFKYS